MKTQSSTPTNPRSSFLVTWARILLILAIALPQAFIGAVPVAHAIDYAWTAYNDCSGTNSITNTTNILGVSGTGTLKNFATGATLTGVTATFTSSGSPNLGTSNGAAANSGTDAYTTFNGKANMVGVVNYGSSSGWYIDLTITGLDQNKTYTFATTANRADSTYTTRISRYTISDISASTNASTSGVTVISNESVSFLTGYNTVNGYVARWTGIQPGSDGDFKVRADYPSNYQAYGMSVFMLAEEITGPTITTTGTLTTFNSAVGTSSAEQSYTVAGTNLGTNPIVITPPTDFEISNTSGSGWVSAPSTISLTPDGSGTVASTPIYVRLKPASAMTYSANITHASTGATQKDVAVSGSSVPAITVTSSLTAFSAEVGVYSAEQNYTVSGINLTGNLAIAAPADFEISTTGGGSGFGSSLSLPPTNGVVGTTTIYVRFKRATTGTSTANITHDSSGAAQKTVAVSGTAAVYYTLTVSGSNGSVTLNPTGGSYASGTIVTLTAVPNSGYAFSSWSGDLSGNTNPTTITMNGNKTVTANFVVSLCTDVSLTVAEDTHMRSGNTRAAYNYGGSTTIRVNPFYEQGSTDGQLTGALLKWDLSSAGIPADATVSAASLTFNVSTGSNYAYSLYNMRQAWVEGTNNGAAGTGASWNFYGAGTGSWGTTGAQSISADRFDTNLWGATATQFNTTGSVTFDLNSDGLAVIQGWVAGSTNNGLTIQNYSGTTTDVWEAASSENTTVANRPKLNLTYCVAPAGPTITTVGTLAALNSGVGMTSAEQSYTVSGANLTDAIVITPPADFEISLTSGSGWVSSPNSISLTPSGGTVSDTTIYVRLNPASAKTYSAVITHTSTGATQKDVAATGSSVPTITATSSLTAFSAEVGVYSAEQNYTVSGINLTGNLAIAAPADFEISTTGGGNGFGSSLSLPPTGGVVGTTTIYVRFKRATTGTSTANITHDSSGAAQKTVAVSGTAAVYYTLTATAGSGGGVTLDPTGGSYASGTVVTLDAVADSGYLFYGWSGDLSGSANPATITMDGDKAVTATFVPGTCSTANLTATEDTYLSANDVQYNNGGNVELHVDATTSTARRTALLKWNLSTIPTAATVSAASLSLYVEDASPLVFNLYNLRRTWVEGTSSQANSTSSANWNTYNGTTSWGTVGAANTGSDRYDTNLWSAGTTSFSTTGAKTLALNLDGVAVVQGWVAGSSNYGLIMQNYSGTTNNAVFFTSSEGTPAANRPILNVTYCALSYTPAKPKPPAVTAIALSGSNDVDLTWDAVTQDVNNNPTTITKYQVYGSHDPFFEPGVSDLLGEPTPPTATTFTHVGGSTGTTNWYYLVRAVNVAGESANSPRRTGRFGFALVPGN
jgi:hypothetical protein